MANSFVDKELAVFLYRFDIKNAVNKAEYDYLSGIECNKKRGNETPIISIELEEKDFAKLKPLKLSMSNECKKQNDLNTEIELSREKFSITLDFNRFVNALLECANTLIVLKEKLIDQDLSYMRLIGILREHFRICGDNNRVILNSVRASIQEYLEIYQRNSYVDPAIDNRSNNSHLLWLIEKYFITDKFKKEQLTSLSLNVNENPSIINGDRFPYFELYKKYFCEYIKKCWNPQYFADSDYEYYYLIFDHNYMIDRLRKYDIIDLYPKTWGDNNEAKISCVKLAYYLKGFEIFSGYEIVKFLKNSDISYVRSSERSDNNSMIIAKMMYDVSLTLDYHFLENCRKQLTYIWVYINSIMKITGLAYEYKKNSINKIVDEIIDTVKNIKVNISDAKKNYNVFESFYMYLNLLEFKAMNGLNDIDDKNKDIDNQAIVTDPFEKYLSFVFSEEQIKCLEYQSVTMTFTLDKYDGMDLVSEEAKAIPPQSILKIRTGRCHDNNDEIIPETVKVKDVKVKEEDHIKSMVNDIIDDAYLAIKIKKAVYKPIELIDFYNKNENQIRSFLLKGKTGSNITKTNIKNNLSNVFFLIYAVAGDSTDGLTVYLCFYLYFCLGSLTVNKRFYNASFSNSAKVKTNISKRELSLSEISTLKLILEMMKKKVLYNEMPSEIDTNMKELSELLINQIKSTIDMHDVFGTAERLRDLSNEIESIKLKIVQSYSNNNNTDTVD